MSQLESDKEQICSECIAVEAHNSCEETEARIPTTETKDDKKEEVNQTRSFSPLKMILIYTVMIVSVSICSSSAAFFAKLHNHYHVPPFWTVNWRLGWVLILQSPMVAYIVFWKKKGDTIAHVNQQGEPEPPVRKTYLQALPLIGISGVCFGLYFSVWVIALAYTSVAHSLLFSGVCPIIFQGLAWIKFGYLFCFDRDQAIRPSTLGTLGTLIGIAASLLLVKDMFIGRTSDSKAEGEDDSAIRPTWYGDMLCLISACTFCVYLTIGRRMQSPPYQLNIWTYSFGLVGCAYLTTLVLALLLSEDSITESASKWFLGLFKTEYLHYVLYLGIGPGLVGHGVLNYLLSYVSPLTISTAFLLEPITGGFVGYLFGIQAVPDIYTWIGGSFLLLGLVCVIRAEYAEAQVAVANSESHEINSGSLENKNSGKEVSEKQEQEILGDEDGKV